MADKNNNNIPDKIEAGITYVIALISILLGVLGYIYRDMEPSHVKWFIGFAVFLTGQRDIKSYFQNK